MNQTYPSDDGQMYFMQTLDLKRPAGTTDLRSLGFLDGTLYVLYDGVIQEYEEGKLSKEYPSCFENPVDCSALEPDMFLVTDATLVPVVKRYKPISQQVVGTFHWDARGWYPVACAYSDMVGTIGISRNSDKSLMRISTMVFPHGTTQTRMTIPNIDGVVCGSAFLGNILYIAIFDGCLRLLMVDVAQNKPVKGLTFPTVGPTYGLFAHEGTLYVASGRGTGQILSLGIKS